MAAHLHIHTPMERPASCILWDGDKQELGSETQHLFHRLCIDIYVTALVYCTFLCVISAILLILIIPKIFF